MIHAAIQITKTMPTQVSDADQAFADALIQVAATSPGPGMLVASYVGADGGNVSINLQMTSVAVNVQPLSPSP